MVTATLNLKNFNTVNNKIVKRKKKEEEQAEEHKIGRTQVWGVVAPQTPIQWKIPTFPSNQWEAVWK